MEIRAARQSDRGAVQGLWSAAGLAIASDDEWRVLIEAGCASMLVAEDGGLVLGVVVVAYDGWRAFLYHLAVSTQARRRGIGRALMAEGEGRLRAKGARLIFALTKKSMTDGIALLGASGYEPDGDIAFVKALDPASLSARGPGAVANLTTAGGDDMA
jgi:ribosomal protein S18 acetylase RimI-like enzyme